MSQSNSENNSQVSHHILARLEGENIRLILHDGSTVEGTVRGADRDKIRLDDRTVPLDKISTYFVLEES
jgi:translation initiation factor IF-1